MKQPHDEAYHAILEAKYSRIISEISEMHDVSIEQAMDIFYTSELLPLLEDGVELPRKLPRNRQGITEGVSILK